MYTLAGWGFGFPFTIFICISVVVSVGISRNADIGHRCAKFWSRTMLWICGIKVSVSGQEHLTEKCLPALIVANHQSIFDIFALGGFFPVRFSWIAKNTLFKIPLLGRAMLMAGYVPVDRGNRENARGALNVAAEYIKDHSIIIFPEGTRSRSGRVGRFKRGASFLAHSTGVPIIPVTITGSWQRLPPGRWMVSPGTIFIQIDPAISTDGKTREEIDSDLVIIRETISNRVDQSEGIPV
jgi:1-acyl-sn-glycerol-3-phosphate acyltransferase